MRLAGAAGLALALAACAAQAGQAGEARWYGLIENDVVFLTDRWYTSGFRLSRVQEAGGHESEWSLVHEVYTPEANHFRDGVIDRGPVGRMLATYARHYRDLETFHTVELAVGVRGPSAHADQITDAVHRIIAARRIDWSRQASDRVDAHLAAVRSQGFGLLNAHFGVVAGTDLAFAHGALELRTGSNACDTISPLLRHAVTPPFSRDPNARGWSAFAAAGGRAVARNRLLSRGYDLAAHAPRRSRWVTRVSTGVSYAASWGAVSFSIAQDSREFEEQREPHRFGSLGFQIGF